MMDARSESFFAKVEPDLVKVLRAAAQTPQPFVVIQGIRSPAQEQTCVNTGHSTTMHSRHLPDCKGFAAAVDVAAVIDGKLSFAKGNEAAVFGAIIAQVRAAATALNIPIEWGGDWKVNAQGKPFTDWGHIQLPWASYP